MNNNKMFDYRAIGKNDDYYIITNDKNATLNAILSKGFIIDSLGRKLTSLLPIGTLIKYDTNWEYVNIPYIDIISEQKNNIMDSIIGFAIGDAFGVPVEFLDRETIRKINLKDMIGCDTTSNLNSRWGKIIPAGSWSDDTSMNIATMDSIIKNSGEINYKDIMDRFLLWIKNNEYTSFGTSFGLGNIVLSAMKRYVSGISPLECGGTKLKDNGNGSLMRILPFSIYCIVNNLSELETVELISNASKITHGHDISKMSCFIYTEYLRNIIETKNPILSLDIIQQIDYSSYFSKEAIEAHRQLLKGNFIFINEDNINASGYVVDTLESVIYSIINSDDFESSVETAVNMGYDTDTVAGLTGAIASILYGRNTIPKRWLEKLKRLDYLDKMIDSFEKCLTQKKSYDK